MKLEEFKFYELKGKGLKGLSVFVGEKEVASGFIVDVLKIIPHLAKYEIESTNTYFDTFVVRLRRDKMDDTQIKKLTVEIGSMKFKMNSAKIEKIRFLHAVNQKIANLESAINTAEREIQRLKDE